MAFAADPRIGAAPVGAEVEVLQRSQAGSLLGAVGSVPPVLSADELAALREAARRVHVEPVLLAYIARIAQASRQHPMLDLGASPRASLGMMASGKALAALRGRDFLIPDDVQAVAFPVLRHRIRLTPDQEMDGRTTDDCLLYTSDAADE